MPILTGEAMDGDYSAGAVPGLSNLFVPSFSSICGDDTDPALADFFARYEADFSARADNSYAVRGYSVVEAWAYVAEKSGNLEAADFAQALDTFADEPLLIGPTTFSPTTRIAYSRAMTIIQAQEGKFAIKDKVSPLAQ